ncbi:hypothetical protein ADINL_0766 [Nitrincola lacisaponensis]|uniref:DUF3087 domain-containing protein n=1 Tax=Nitrincola lacisaponensis TaxID=267850 RepID=A0A063Y3A7_9GAMM|nr:DUF3087 family protein [Nitrincola lacisaponensis]KDE40174.1 hypothetical protein ADINL_0766 [Nitrincola lacisaponensis]
MADIFELEARDPDTYRQQTRKSTLVLIVIFVVLAMGLSTLSVSWFGHPEGNNFVWNVAGVFAGFVLTTIIFKQLLWHHPLMNASVYGWKLKRSLMSITNNMHHIEAGVAQDNITAIQLLRFYHLALSQMHKLEGNDTGISELQKPIQALLLKIEAQGLDPQQNRFDPEWIDAVKQQVS